MLDSLLDGIKGQIASTIAEKVGIDVGQAEQTVPLAGESIKEGLMGAVSGGNVSDIMGMFSGGNMQQSGIFQTISSMFISKLTGAGIGGGSAISALALPMILNKIKGAASNDAGEMDASGLMNVLGGDAAGLLGGLTGGGAGGALGAAMGALSGGADNAGGLLGGVMDAVTGGANDAKEGAGGLLGGVMDAVTGGAGDAKEGAGGLLGSVMDAVTGGADDAKEGAGDITDALKDKAGDMLKDGLGSLFGKK